jgi:hypothetical protein
MERDEAGFLAFSRLLDQRLAEVVQNTAAAHELAMLYGDSTLAMVQAQQASAPAGQQRFPVLYRIGNGFINIGWRQCPIL